MRKLQPLPGQTQRSFMRHLNRALPTYIYRAYDRDGLLLYVGCTDNPKRRIAEHEAGRSGTSRTLAALGATFEVDADQYPDRTAGEIAEAKAIRDEIPLLNFQRSLRPGWLRDREVARYLTERGLPLEIAGLHRCPECDILRGSNMPKGVCQDCRDEVTEAGAA